jgi:phage shock protein PspC (stress-responsive transcriptional regulator)
MKKVVTVHLDNEVFQMEEDGFHKIQKVLKKIETASANGPILVKDIEQKIADLLKQKMVNNLITEAQVDEVLTSLGYAAYYRETEFNQGFSTGYKRLYRHPNDKVIGGVCSGIAAYLNTDPALIRVLFVVLLFGFGSGLLLYIILWIVIPQAHSLDQLYGNK